MDFGLELIVLDLLVALEGNAVDDRIFDDRDGQPSALDRRSNILEQTGGNKRLDAFIDLESVKLAVRSRPEVGADSVSLDPLVALNHDRVDGLRMGSWCRKRHHSDTQRNPPESEARDAQPANKPLTKFHSPRPLSSPLGASRFESTHEKGRRDPQEPLFKRRRLYRLFPFVQPPPHTP